MLFSIVTSALMTIFAKREFAAPTLERMGPIAIWKYNFLSMQAIHHAVMLIRYHVINPKHLSRPGHLILNWSTLLNRRIQGAD